MSNHILLLPPKTVWPYICLAEDCFGVLPTLVVSQGLPHARIPAQLTDKEFGYGLRSGKQVRGCNHSDDLYHTCGWFPRAFGKTIPAKVIELWHYRPCRELFKRMPYDWQQFVLNGGLTHGPAEVLKLDKTLVAHVEFEQLTRECVRTTLEKYYQWQ